MLKRAFLSLPAQFRAIIGITITIIVSLFILFMLPVAYLFVSMLPPVYYADYNTIRARLERLPNTHIIDTWLHEDVSLEDFGFTLQQPTCPPVTINFYQVHGSRWFKNFQSIDGVILEHEEQPNTSESIARLSRAELEQLDLPIHNVEDIFTHLAPLLEQLNKQPLQTSDGIQGADGSFAHLSYDGGVCTMH